MFLLHEFDALYVIYSQLNNRQQNHDKNWDLRQRLEVVDEWAPSWDDVMVEFCSGNKRVAGWSCANIPEKLVCCQCVRRQAVLTMDPKT